MKLVIYGGTIVYHIIDIPFTTPLKFNSSPLKNTPCPHPPPKKNKACFPTIHFSGDVLNIGGVTNQKSCQL